MKKIVGLLFFLIIIFCLYWFLFRKKSHADKAPKQAPIALKKHSAAFNRDVDSMINAYLRMKDGFVNDDTSAVKQSSATFITFLDSIALDELKTDSAGIYETVKANIGDVKSNAESLLKQTDIFEMRRDFSMVTEMMFPSLFTAINYEGPKLFVLHCPTAFGENMGANWISQTSGVTNPYAGKKAGNNVQCGELKDSIVSK